jgi:hypothetical protein
MITDYEVVCEHDICILQSKVKEKLLVGWQPFGSLQVSTPVLNGDNVAPLYSQAMVKVDSEK